MDAADWNSQLLSLVANRDKILRYVFILQFIAAIPLLWLATITGRHHAQLLLRGRAASGTVAAVVPVHFTSRSGTSSTAYEPVVSFTVGAPPRADEFRFQEWKGMRTAPSVGTKVSVLYDPEDPDIAMVDRGYLNYLPWAPCAAIGTFLLLVALKGLLSLLFRTLGPRAG